MVKKTTDKLPVNKILRLYQANDRSYLLKRLKHDENLFPNPEEIEKSILFLLDNLGKEWLTVYPLGQGSVSIKIGPKNSQGLNLFSVVIPLGLALLTLSKLKGFERLVEKLSIQSNERLSSILEALCASRYKTKGYDVELEPSTEKGHYSDFRVKFGKEWIYFECKKEYPRESKYFKNLSKHANEITQEILKSSKSKLPSKYRIDIILFKRVQKNTLKTVISRLCNCLDAQEYDLWQEIEGVKFAVNSKGTHVELPSPLYVRQGEMEVGTKPTKLGEENTYLQIIYKPFGIRELQKMRRIIKEAKDQIPKSSRGVIILNTQHPQRMLKVAEEKLTNPKYGHIIAILVTGNGAWSVPNLRHHDFPPNFLKIAVQSA